MLKDLILKNRSYRRFYGNETIPKEELLNMIDNARLSASARNAQCLKYFISNDPVNNSAIFPHLAWAGYLRDWDGPEEDERPSAYIIQLLDTQISERYFCDDGIAAQSITLTAVEKGFGACIIASVKKEALSEYLKLPGHLKILQVIALGKPKEKVLIEDIQNDDFKYWRDENQVHHVPKRKLSELIINLSEIKE